jgi:putative transposase
VVDTTGLVVQVQVHAADLPDAVGGRLVLAGIRQRYPRLAHLWADAAYRGSFADWAQSAEQLEIEVVERAPIQQHGPPRPHFQPAPRRWVVERTFAWLGRNRRMSRDYEYLPESQRANVHICMIRLMLQRLAP